MTGGDISSHDKEVHVRHESSDLAAGGNVAISAGRDFMLSGSKVVSGGSMAITAGGGVLVESLIDMDHRESHYEEEDGSFWNSGSSSEDYARHDERLVQSRLAAAGNLKIESGDIQTYRG